MQKFLTDTLTQCNYIQNTGSVLPMLVKTTKRPHGVEQLCISTNNQKSLAHSEETLSVSIHTYWTANKK